MNPSMSPEVQASGNLGLEQSRREVGFEPDSEGWPEVFLEVKGRNSFIESQQDTQSWRKGRGHKGAAISRQTAVVLRAQWSGKARKEAPRAAGRGKAFPGRQLWAGSLRLKPRGLTMVGREEISGLESGSGG